ncbi:hypothetical protein ACFYUY_01390 [Kitasatospora sp. NPDC004745]
MIRIIRRWIKAPGFVEVVAKTLLATGLLYGALFALIFAQRWPR